MGMAERFSSIFSFALRKHKQDTNLNFYNLLFGTPSEHANSLIIPIPWIVFSLRFLRLCFRPLSGFHLCWHLLISNSSVMGIAFGHVSNKLCVCVMFYNISSVYAFHQHHPHCNGIPFFVFFLSYMHSLCLS